MLWLFLLVIFAAGAVGGLVNALLSDNAFILPRRTGRTGEIVRWGSFTNMFIGGMAATISWGLYGPFANLSMMGSQGENAPELDLTLSAIIGAVLVGIGGARWLTSLVDERLLRASGKEYATMQGDPKMAKMFDTEKPAELLTMSMTEHENEKQDEESAA